MGISRRNTGHLLKRPPLSSGTCLEPRGGNPGLVIIAVCSLWVCASLALALEQQQGLFPDPSTWTPAELPPEDFSTFTSVQNDTDQSQGPWGLAKEAVPLPPEVRTEGQTAPGNLSLSHVVPEGSKDKGASRRTRNQQNQNSSSLLSQHSSLGLGSRLPPQIRALHANETLSLKTQGPPKSHTEESLAQINPIDADGSRATGLPQTPSIDSLGTMRPTESVDPMGDCKICLGHQGLSTESAVPAAASKVQAVKSSSRALSHPQYEVGFAPSPSKEGLVSVRTHPNPGPPETPRPPSLPKEARGAFSAVPFPSLGVSRGTESESHVPKLLRASLFSPSSENPRGQTTSTSAILATSSWPIESELHSRGPKKVAPASKDSSPISPLDHIWSSAFPTPTRFEERSPSVIGSDGEFLATIKEHEGHSRLRGFCSDPILQRGLPTQRSELLSAGSRGVFEEASEPVEAADSDLGFLPSLPLRGVTPKGGLSPAATSEALSPSALGNEETDSSILLPETLRATSELPRPEPTRDNEVPDTPITREPSTGMSLYGPTRHVRTLQPGPHRLGAASSQPSFPVFPGASFPTGTAQDSGWAAEPKIFVSSPSPAPFPESPLTASPGASAKPQTSQVPVSNAAAEVSQSSSVASALQGSPEATAELSHLSENSPLARNGSPSSPGTRATGEGAELWMAQPWLAHTASPSSRVGGGRTKSAPFLSSLQTPAQIKTRASKAPVLPKPSASPQPVIPESLGMPEEQLENISEVGAGSASLDQAVPTDLAAFLPGSWAKGSTPTPPTTWANTFPSELEKAQTSLGGRQERGRCPPGMMSHPVLGTPAHVIRWLGSNHSPSKLMIEPLKRSTSPMAVPSRPEPGRGIWRSWGVLPNYPWSTSEREGLIALSTSETGGAGGELTKSTPVLEEDQDEDDPSWNPKFENHKIPLKFRLNLISYNPALADNSSVSFRRLKWEVTFTFRQMLSHMNGFHEFYVFQFLDGSVFVQSEVEVTGDPRPTSSDIIRCIVTMVYQKMKTYFSWNVDLPSLSSNGYWMENLEPEKLHVAFRIPKSGLLSTGDALHYLLQNLTEQMMQNLEELYPVTNIDFFDIRENQGNLYLKAEALSHSQTWADIPSVLEALIHLANLSVDLSSLSVEGHYLNLQLLPITFHIINRKFETFLLEPRDPEHQAFFQDLAIAVKHALSSYGGLLQVIIQDCLNDSFICVGELLFQIPSPEVQDILQTLHKAITSDGHLADSQFQVDSSSFLIAEEHLDSPEPKNRASIISAAISLSILIVFISAFLIIQCLRNRICHEGVFPRPPNYQMQSEMIELESQQAESPLSGRDNLGLQVALEEESSSSC
ncbi:serine/arginine repetitive matrix protein 2-like [Antechinus flavipes]|uniref:serine/arginine repetitive matrix protein 2-like n=1 Tax=Antechinus flavipes TaxID=38775 RepID=UPI002235C827|nr:serine/arginine repetitive matrix protein 2-like [Antechinus flavipes]